MEGQCRAAIRSVRRRGVGDDAAQHARHETRGDTATPRLTFCQLSETLT